MVNVEWVEQSPWFDAEWYRAEYPEVAHSGLSPAVHYLQQGEAEGRWPGPNFDPAWYRQAYADVAAAGVSPLLHFLRHGLQEGRLPHALEAEAWERALWQQHHPEAGCLEALTALLESERATEASYAAFALGRWHASREAWPAAAAVLARREAGPCALPCHLGPALLTVEAFGRAGRLAQAWQALAELQRQAPAWADTRLAVANLLAWQAAQHGEAPEALRAEWREQRLGWLNALWAAHGLSDVAAADPTAPLSLDNLADAGHGQHRGAPGGAIRAAELRSHQASAGKSDCSPVPGDGIRRGVEPAAAPERRTDAPTATSSFQPRSGALPASSSRRSRAHPSPLTIHPSPFTDSGAAGPLVSVIIPAFNAAEALPTALASLVAQRLPPGALEVLVVDDASKDATAAVAEAFAARHAGVRVIRQAHNQGAYAARNRGLVEARGEVITVHDSDDWSHPDKLAVQLQGLRDHPAWQACCSHWVRCTPGLVFGRWRMEEGWTYRNVSSLMFRRRVFETLGFWDRVRVEADTEYYYRLRAAFGPEAVGEVLPGVPLAFGRAEPRSLTATGATHLATQFRGVRAEYRRASEAWHRAAAGQPERLYLPAEPGERPFAAPAAMLP